MSFNHFNILILSVGRRTCLLEYFKKELKGQSKVVATDCSNLAPALYVADKHYIVPRINQPDYINVIKNICNKEKITAILSLIDPELSILAKHSEELKEIGVTTIVSPYKTCELFLDKYDAYEFYKYNSFKCAKTYNSLFSFEKALKQGAICFPVFIKPRKGSASLNINIARNMEEVKFIFNSSEDMIIQEFLKGQELGVDIYVDMISKKVISIFIKEKVTMRAGETDKSKSIKCPKLFRIIEKFVVESGLVGPIDMDIFDVKGEYYISEVNPRFGGGYPHAYECGVNFPKYIIRNLKSIVNEPEIGNYEQDIYMMKHDILTIKKL